MTRDGDSILLVDDSTAHRTLIKRALHKAGIRHVFVEAGSLREARVRLFSAHGEMFAPLLTIVDLNLGDGRGTTLIAELRASDRHAARPILVLSTSALEQDMRESYAQGANCYLTKADDISVFSYEIAAAVRFLLGSPADPPHNQQP
jgi:DNA-binding response OmpR family regulator